MIHFFLALLSILSRWKCLTDIGTKGIDYLIVTHFHTDHMGGVPQLAAKLPIRYFIDHGSDIQIGDRAAAAFKPYDDLRMKADHVVAKPGYTIPITGIKAQVIAAAGTCSHLPCPVRASRTPSVRTSSFRKR